LRFTTFVSGRQVEVRRKAEERVLKRINETSRWRIHRRSKPEKIADLHEELAAIVDETIAAKKAVAIRNAGGRAWQLIAESRNRSVAYAAGCLQPW
jgi:hypothetical protein